MKKTNYKNNNEFLSNFSDRLEIHIKYGNDWLCSFGKDNVSGIHIGHVIDFGSMVLKKSVEDLFSGKIPIESLPKIKSHGMTVGIIMPDDEGDLK